MGSQFHFVAEVHDELLFVTEQRTEFYAVYEKRPDAPQLMLVRRSPTNDHGLIAWRLPEAAVSKARELGWIA